MKNISDETVANLAIANHQFIPILEKYNIDFCCKGKIPLSKACLDKNLNVDTIVEELTEAISSEGHEMPYQQMNASQLISTILIKHHFYIKNNYQIILQQIDKVVTKHGDKYLYMKQVSDLFNRVMEELIPHMEKEELLLFPRILEIVQTKEKQPDHQFTPDFLIAPVKMMESEHEKAGTLMFEIRKITNHYLAPEGACTTHRVCLEALKYFEEDLHKHIHLENNLLFPMALNLIKE